MPLPALRGSPSNPIWVTFGVEKRYPIEVARLVLANTNPQALFHEVPRGALIDCVCRYDCTTSTGYVTLGTSVGTPLKLLASDGLVRVKLQKTGTTTLAGDGTTTGTFRALGVAWGGSEPFQEIEAEMYEPNERRSLGLEA